MEKTTPSELAGSAGNEGPYLGTSGTLPEDQQNGPGFSLGDVSDLLDDGADEIYLAALQNYEDEVCRRQAFQ